MNRILSDSVEKFAKRESSKTALKQQILKKSWQETSIWKMK